MSKYPISKDFFPFSHFAPPISEKFLAIAVPNMKTPKFIYKDKAVDVRRIEVKSYDGEKIECFFMSPKALKDKAPCLIYIHGGGFMAGDKVYRKGLGTWFALNGYFTINVNYGLSPEYVFPKPLKHLISSLGWIERNAEKLNLDLSKIIIAGDSAGAYYALTVATVMGNEDLKRELNVKNNIKFSAAILNCGVYDIKKALEGKFLFNLNKKVFEASTGITEEKFLKYRYKKFFSPVDLVEKDFPPTFLIYAEKDLLCNGHAELLIDKFDEKDVYFESFCSTSVLDNHCFSLEWKRKTAKIANQMLETFLLKLKNNDLPRKQSETTVYIRGRE